MINNFFLELRYSLGASGWFRAEMGRIQMMVQFLAERWSTFQNANRDAVPPEPSGDAHPAPE